MGLLTFRVSLVLAGVLALGAVLLGAFDHETFLAGVGVGVLAMLALVLTGVAVVTRTLEDRMLESQEKLSEQLGFDVTSLMESLASDGEDPIKS